MKHAMQWFNGKRLLSFFRNADYAHPGEEEAVLLTFSKFPKSNNKNILDVGCGLGGTAQLIQDHGWGKVTGIDIEPAAIEYAKKKYPTIDFYASDAMKAHTVIKNKKFDVFCMFSVFSVLADQTTALKSLNELAGNNAELIVFEYTNLTPDGSKPFIDKNETHEHFYPIRFSDTEFALQQAGWQCYEIQEINEKYKDWYESLLMRIENKKNEAINLFGETAYEHAKNRYLRMHEALLNGRLGGAILYAKRAA